MVVQKGVKKTQTNDLYSIYIFLIIPRILKLNLLHSTVCEKKVLRR